MVKKVPLGTVQKVVEVLLRTESKRATKYLSPVLIIRAVRKTFGKKIIKRANIEITLTIGKPNYLEREFIKLCQKAKEPFPVKHIQFKS